MKIAATFLIALALGTTASFASDLDFVLVNETGRSFEALYVSPSSATSWNGNLLVEGDVIKAGESQKVDFSEAPNEAQWDINIVDDEGLSVNFDDVNLINVKKFTLKEENGQITATVE